MILKRNDNDRFSRVSRHWDGEAVAILGAGPSITFDQIERIRAAHAAGEIRCIAVNDTYLWAPWADVHYAADSHWHKWHTQGIEKPLLGMSAEQVRILWSGFKGQKCTIENSGANVTDEAVHMLRNKTHPNHGVGLSLDPSSLVTGRNSGFQALNLAVLAGATTILLLGFDGKVSTEGKSHFFGAHPRPTPEAVYPYYRQAMSAAENALIDAGVTVLNCSPGSAIDSFKKVTIEEVI